MFLIILTFVENEEICKKWLSQGNKLVLFIDQQLYLHWLMQFPETAKNQTSLL
jgi:hypothetical protein